MTSAQPPKPMESRIGWSDAAGVYIYGHNLAEDLMGRVDLGAMAFLELTGRLPKDGESIVIDAMLVALVEHGITPSALAARLTTYGAPEAIQGAVAAGLLGLGSVFVGAIEGVARLLQTALPATEPLQAIAERIVAEHRAKRAVLPGFGHPVHKPHDPRAVRLQELAAAHRLDGTYINLLNAIGSEADRQFGKHLVLNVTGVIGALASEMGIHWRYARGLGVMAPAVGLIGHIREEIESPIAPQIWTRVNEEATRKLRNV